MKRAGTRSLAILAIALVTTLAALAVILGFGPRSQGFRLAISDGYIRVASVDYGSEAAASGMHAGQIVTDIDNINYLTRAQAPSDVLYDLIGRINVAGTTEIGTIEPGELAQELTWRSSGGTIFGTASSAHWFPIYDRRTDWLPLGIGLVIFIAGWWWIGTGRAGSKLVPFAMSIPLAAGMPLMVVPLVRALSIETTMAASLLLALGGLPAAFQFAGGIKSRRRRWLLYLVVCCLAAASSVAGLFVPEDPRATSGWFSVLWVVTTAAVTLVPGLVGFAVPAWRASPPVDGGPGRRLVDRAMDLAPVVTPAIAGWSVAYTDFYNFPAILLWFLVLGARRVSVEPVSRLLNRAVRQRDLVATATEAERARIAADIHDYALQDLTMLVRRLDASGDSENAQTAREVADRLRLICGDLRLPILDDLGVGSALEWLCDRFERVAGKIGLDRLEDEKRLPPTEELAFFRVAQEAVSNAVRHGAPPILVRYRGGGSWAELEVDDSGAGLTPDAAEKAEQIGHLGLLTMGQRAQSIGAQLTLGRRPGGGTRVRLVWEGAGRAPEAAAGEQPISDATAEPA